MKRSQFLRFFILAVSAFLIITNFCYAQNDDTEYIEINGEKIPLIQDPCELKGTPVEEAALYSQEYTNLQYAVRSGQEAIEGIKAGEIENKNLLSRIVELSLFNWSCQNNFLLHNSNYQGIYFFSKDNDEKSGIFVGIKADGYLDFDGIIKGQSSFELDVRGRFMDTYYLQVIITKLDPDPSEQYSTELNEEAEKILNDIVEFSYEWGLAYYNEIIRLSEQQGE